MPTKELKNIPFDNDKDTPLNTEAHASESVSSELTKKLTNEASTEPPSEASSFEADISCNASEKTDNTPSESSVMLVGESADAALDKTANSSVPSSDENQAEDNDISSDANYLERKRVEPASNYDIFGNLENSAEPDEVPLEAATETVFVAEPPELSEDSTKDDAQETFEAVYPEAFPDDEKTEEPAPSEYEDCDIDASYNEEENRHPIHGLFDFLELFVFSFVAVLVFTTFFFRHSVVEGNSMIDTLHEGEHLIISDLFYTPERGDIIVCEDYSTSLRKPIVKRVIATEGDYVQVLITGEVFINGKLIEEDYVYIDGPLPITPVDTVVPEGEVFVMGDHRNMSTDSRMFGTIDEDSIIGKVLLRFYPFDTFGRVE